MPATSLRIITIVVVSIAVLAFVGVATLAFCLVRGVHSDPVLTTAFVGITTGLIGALTGLLINTRSQTGEPISTNITNPPNQPIPTMEAAPVAEGFAPQ